MPKCLICGKNLKFVNSWHLKTHGITMAEYRGRFPDAKIQELGYLRGILRCKSVEDLDKKAASILLVTCLICGRDFRQITNTHLKTHGFTLKKYKDVYPEAMLLCGEVLEQKRQAGEACQSLDIVRQRITSEENVSRLRKMAKPASLKSRESPKTVARWEKARDVVQQRNLQEFVYCQESGVQCQICGEWFRDITNTHLELHGTTQEEYAERFGCGVHGTGSVEAQSESMCDRLSDPGMRQKWSGAAKVLWQDPEHRNKMAKARAGQSHSGPTSIELILNSILDNLNVDYKTQVPIDGYVVDALVENWLILEAYGDYWHNYPDGTERDEVRTEHLRNLNFQVLPFWGRQLRDNPDGCADRISYVLDCT